MLNRIRKMREKKGFTLVELIVVIAIIAILTAVIVPLVGRYAAQATYSTVQDAAKTISTSTSTVVADATMMGTVIPDAIFGGWKTGDALEFTDTIPTQGSFNTKLEAALETAVPNGAVFRISIKGNAVEGVMYSTSLTAEEDSVALLVGADVDDDGNFEEAHTLSDNPVGVAGNYSVFA